MNAIEMSGKTIQGKILLERETQDIEGIGDYIKKRAKNGETYVIKKEKDSLAFYHMNLYEEK